MRCSPVTRRAYCRRAGGARLRLKNGKIPFEPGELPPMLDRQWPAAEPLAAGSSFAQTVPSFARHGTLAPAAPWPKT
jgi:hypothetical protein